VVFWGICGLTAWWAQGRVDPEVALWTSVVPPLLAIVTAFVTQHVMVSLGVAILVGGLLTQWPHLGEGVTAWGTGLKTSVGFVTETVPVYEDGRFQVPENLFILGFVVVIFAVVELLIQAGGFNGVIRLLLKRIKGRRSAELICAILGVSCFIDDYTNAIVVGSAMRPITDRYGVSREKLAFLVDATSAPIAGLAVISTWIAYEVGLFTDMAGQLGIEKSGYALFFDALSFRFYCVLMIGFVFLLILVGRDFGPMKQAQDRTDRSFNEADSRGGLDGLHIEPGLARSALIPMGGLIVFHLIALWLAGGGVAKLQAGQSMLDWTHWRQAISDVPSSSRILLYSSSFALWLAVVCAVLFERVSWRQICLSIAIGFRKGLLPVVILILAWSMKNCCSALKTGDFLSSVLADSMAPHWFAPLVFVVASVTSFATGTSYGTMAILIPTAVPVAFHLDGGVYGLTTMVTLGAVLDGAIFGDHCSPISDTTILSSISTQCVLIDHVRTQIPYSLFVAGLALCVGYVPSAWGLPWTLSVGTGVALMTGMFILLKRR
jgi:Na+/H+ antiporter NhaC